MCVLIYAVSNSSVRYMTVCLHVDIRLRKNIHMNASFENTHIHR